VTTIVTYAPGRRELDLSQLSPSDYEMIAKLRGNIGRGDRVLLCKQAAGDRELYVWKHESGQYYARHYPGDACGSDHAIHRMTDEHLRGTDCWLRAWDAAGFSPATEVTTDNRVRLDAVAFAKSVTALETQVQPQTASAVKGRHTKRLRARAFTGNHARVLGEPLQVIWFAPVGRPEWLYHVPTVQCQNRSWEVTPAPGSVAAIGVREFEVKACSSTWFPRCPDRRSGWCGKPHLWMQLRGGLTIADVAEMVPERHLIPVEMPSGMTYLTDQRSYARCKSFGYTSPPIPEPTLARKQKSTSCAWTGHARSDRARCQMLTLGREGCGCAMCTRELLGRDDGRSS
jgi:hypothetical protein